MSEETKVNGKESVAASGPAAPVKPANPLPASPAQSMVSPASTPAPAAAPAMPAPAPLPNPLAHVPLPFQAVEYALKGYHLDATVEPEQVVSAAEQMDKEGFSLDTITGVDWLAANQMEVVYDFFHPRRFLRVVVRTRVLRENAEVPTICGVFPGANWHERETHDFFGIRFRGHPNLLPFLLPEDATYHPLRKDFKA